MTADRIRRLLPTLPDGDTEIYFHPAVRRDALLDRLMPDYEHEVELATLIAIKTLRNRLGKDRRDEETR